ncbi:MAG: DUF92 domain-containing protein [Gemmatimonadetes bacterium]|nr:DUF92 domain-containing protein [Gemmatimonadota bacterium]
MLRALAGALAAGLVTARARVTGSLGPSGQAAAFALGVLSAAASWGAAVTLVAFFVAADLVTRWREEEKMRVMIATVPQAKLRDATQVLANGLVFVLFALYAMRHTNPRWSYAALGSLAAASADTWATEIGTMLGGTPRSLMTWRPVNKGMSGGITFVGTLASAVGALLVAVVGAIAFGLTTWRAVVVILVAGVAGALADSFAGDTMQTKRWCDRCREWTERRVHPCGYRTKHRRGISWLTNDLVNFICTGAGAVVAVVVARLVFPPR